MRHTPLESSLFFVEILNFFVIIPHHLLGGWGGDGGGLMEPLLMPQKYVPGNANFKGGNDPKKSSKSVVIYNARTDPAVPDPALAITGWGRRLSPNLPIFGETIPP